MLADSEDAWERCFFGLLEIGKFLTGVHCQMGFLDRGLFERMGGFRPDLRLAEDVDLMRRAARLPRIRRKTSLTAAGISRGLMTPPRHLVTERTVSAWSSTSCTAPAFSPIAARGTCPAMTSTGEERAQAVATPAAAL